MDVSKIEGIVKAFAEGTDLFLVEAKVSPTNEIEVVVDSDSAVTIDRCVALSHAIEAAFDRDSEDFELSVMSAGVGQPLKLSRQFQKTLGKPVEAVMKDGMKYAGTLESFDDQGISIVWEEKQLVEGHKRKQLVEVRKTLPFSEMKSVVREIEFK